MIGMDVLAYLVQQFKDRQFENALTTALQADHWHQEEGFSYATLTDHAPIRELLSAQMDPERAAEVLERIEVDLIQVTGVIKLHYHGLSDSCLIVDPRRPLSPLCGLGFFEPSHWRHLDSGQIIPLPRGTVHGFQVNPAAKNMYLIGINYPPIGEADTHYVS